MNTPARTFALCAAIAIGVLTTGCTSTVGGVAVKPNPSLPGGPGDNVAPLDESALDGLMLSNSELNKITGVELESFYAADEMNDNADLVSDADCLGAVYPGEDAVYDGTGWAAVRDELFLESGGADDARLVEQTLVLFDKPDDAADFFEASKHTWNGCAQIKDIEVEDGSWVPNTVEDVDQQTIALKAHVSGSLTGVCQHAMGVVANLIVEAFSCDVDDRQDAREVAKRILADAHEQ